MARVSTEVNARSNAKPLARRSSAAVFASARPLSVRSTSVQPVNRFSWFHVDSPCRSRTTLYISLASNLSGRAAAERGGPRGEASDLGPVARVDRRLRRQPRPADAGHVGQGEELRRGLLGHAAGRTEDDLRKRPVQRSQHAESARLLRREQLQLPKARG